jgi:predicted restriction endonuclease
MLERYVQNLSHLRTDKNRKKWSPLTRHQAPHKPFLLLSVLDLVAEGAIQKNLIAPSLDLVETFNGYWSRIMPSGTKGNMAHPFPCLKTDGFWHPSPIPDMKAKSTWSSVP